MRSPISYSIPSLSTLARLVLSLMVVVTLGFPVLASAQFSDQDQLHGAASESYGDSETTGSLTAIIGSIINVLLSILGLILLLLVIYAGFLWMTAGGNSDQVDKAKKFIVNGVIGLIITLTAYAISNFVVDTLQTANLAS